MIVHRNDSTLARKRSFLLSPESGILLNLYVYNAPQNKRRCYIFDSLFYLTKKELSIKKICILFGYAEQELTREFLSQLDDLIEEYLH